RSGPSIPGLAPSRPSPGTRPPPRAAAPPSTGDDPQDSPSFSVPTRSGRPRSPTQFPVVPSGAGMSTTGGRFGSARRLISVSCSYFTRTPGSVSGGFKNPRSDDAGGPPHAPADTAIPTINPRHATRERIWTSIAPPMLSASPFGTGASIWHDSALTAKCPSPDARMHQVGVARGILQRDYLDHDYALRHPRQPQLSPSLHCATMRAASGGTDT